jgi:iron complex transport system substrate-binding protein
MIKITAFNGVPVRLAILLVCVALAVPTRASDTPRRIVSFNLCADQLLLALADPSQIAGLSPYADDATLSVMTAEAARFPQLDWSAESVVSTGADLVLAGPSDRPTRAMLGAMGMRVAEVTLVRDVAGAQQQARKVGALIGHPDRGELLARKLDNAQNELVAAALKPARTAMVIERGGYSEGPESLIAAMLKSGGLRSPASETAGLGGFISMEKLLIDAPDILVFQDAPRDAFDQGALFLTHPALRARYGPQRRIDLPARYSLCGGPALLEGLQFLTMQINALK